MHMQQQPHNHCAHEHALSHHRRLCVCAAWLGLFLQAPLSSRLQANLLHTHSIVNKATLGNGMVHTGDEENVPVQHNQSNRSAAAALTLVKAGSAVVANGSGNGSGSAHTATFEKVIVYNDNKENAPSARVTRSRVASNSCALGAADMSGGGGAPSCGQPTATGLANTQLHQKPRRVLQEIKV